jgi:hypothetical protein
MWSTHLNSLDARAASMRRPRETMRLPELESALHAIQIPVAAGSGSDCCGELERGWRGRSFFRTASASRSKSNRARITIFLDTI